MNRRIAARWRRAGLWTGVLLTVVVVGAGCALCCLGATPTGQAFYGRATWYGRQFHGRTTASGEVYDMYQLTAASRTLPFGTRVEVRNMENGRTVVVRINDRGPVPKKYIIDLSYAAARKLEMIGGRPPRVRLVVLGGPAPTR